MFQGPSLSLSSGNWLHLKAIPVMIYPPITAGGEKRRLVGGVKYLLHLLLPLHSLTCWLQATRSGSVWSHWANRDCAFKLSQAWSPITNVLMNIKAGLSKGGTSDSSHQPPCPATSYSGQVYHHTDRLAGKYIMTRTDFRGGQFPHHEDTDDPWNTGLLTIQPHDMAATPRIFYWV
jgi:hypothetical protein